MDIRSIKCAIFMGFAVFKDSQGKLYTVDLLDDITQEFSLPIVGTHFLWGKNYLVGAAETLRWGSKEVNRYWPFGLRDNDDEFVPWNRWLPITKEEKAAEIPGLSG